MIFGASTPILTYGGAIPVSQVVVGTMVLTHAGRFRRVQRAYAAGPVNVNAFRLTAKDGSTVLASWNHAVFIDGRVWVLLSEDIINPGVGPKDLVLTSGSVQIANGTPAPPFVPRDRLNPFDGVLNPVAVASCVAASTAGASGYDLVVAEDVSYIAGGVVVQSRYQ